MPPFPSANASKDSIEHLIRIGAVLLLIVTCGMIMSPFIMIILWSLIISISLGPVFQKLTRMLGGRGKTAASLLGATGLALVIVPTVLLSESIAVGAKALSQALEAGVLVIPPPENSVRDWPVIGEWLHNLWMQASTNLIAILQPYSAEIKSMASSLLKAAAGVGGAILQFTLAIVIAAAMLANAEGGVTMMRKLFIRLAGKKGVDYINLAGKTVRSVAAGVVGVAIIQALASAIGFALIGVPYAGLWALAVLLLAIIQVPVFVVIAPIIVYAYGHSDAVPALVFAIYMILVGASDNILKPILMGRDAQVPVLIILMGAIGGMLLSGIIGLFVGAVVLALGYELFIAWVNEPEGA